MLTVKFKGCVGRFNLDVDFQADRGVTALFGSSGAGKSTILRAIAGLWTPDEGQIVISERVLFDSVSQVNVQTEQRRLGVVFQEPLLFPNMSVQKNLRYGEGADTSHWETVIDLFDLQELLERMPRNLSGGEAQRVALGRALLAHPQALLLDEPLTGIDDARREMVLPYFEKIRDEMSVPIIYVSHSIEEISRLADTIIMVEQGVAKNLLTPAEFNRAINLPPALKRDRS